LKLKHHSGQSVKKKTWYSSKHGIFWALVSILFSLKKLEKGEKRVKKTHKRGVSRRGTFCLNARAGEDPLRKPP